MQSVEKLEIFRGKLSQAPIQLNVKPFIITIS